MATSPTPLDQGRRSPIPFDVPSLDQLLAEHAAAPVFPVGVKSEVMGIGEAFQVETLLERLTGVDEQLQFQLSALGELIGSTVLSRIAGNISRLTDVAREAHRRLQRTEQAAYDARSRALDLVTARDDARATAVLLEGALEAAAQREARARGLLEEWTRDAREAEAADLTDDERALLARLADRLALALDFDADADPAEVALAAAPTPGLEESA